MIDKTTRDAIEAAQRLTAMGIHVRSPELAAEVKAVNEFYERGGNRAMRRAAAKRKN